MAKINKEDGQWQQQLSAQQYSICRCGGTETAFTGRYYQHKEEGTYLCVCCGAALFSSEHKYDSGSGWPSYWEPLNETALLRLEDRAHGMVRVEVRCSQCDAHLGHEFPDGPKPTGLRFCINSASLDFQGKAD
ncbi:MAG: peptide-methionine (R)-S-oxide reductase MsrB [Motiliproteus sp.]